MFPHYQPTRTVLSCSSFRTQEPILQTSIISACDVLQADIKVDQSRLRRPLVLTLRMVSLPDRILIFFRSEVGAGSSFSQMRPCRVIQQQRQGSRTDVAIATVEPYFWKESTTIKANSSSSSSSCSPQARSIAYYFFSFFLTSKVQTFILPLRHPSTMYFPLAAIDTTSLSETFKARQHLKVFIFHTQIQPSTPPPTRYSPAFARQQIEVLGKRPNIPFITSIYFFSTLSIHIPSAQAVACIFSSRPMPLTDGSIEGITFADINWAVRRSQQQAMLLGVELSVAKMNFVVSPTVETVVEFSGSRISSLVYRNSRSHNSKVPPSNPTRQSLSTTVKAEIYQGFVMIFCFLLLISSITMNLPATYTMHSNYTIIVKNSLVIAKD